MRRPRRRVPGTVAAVAAIMLVSGSVVGLGSSAGATSPWSIVTSPTRAGTALSYLEGVSCVSSTDCFAVGGEEVGDAGGGQTLVERWDGTRWSILPSPNGGPLSALYGVSCVNATDCTAVGNRVVNGLGTQALVEHWDGARWSIVASPDPISKAVYLWSVSCVIATSCIAVGNSDDGFKSATTLVERWDGARWSIVPSPNPTKLNFLSDVSCVSATDCVAVGSATVAGQSVPLVLRWDGTRLSSETISGHGLGTVSCTSATSCLAIGSYGNDTHLYNPFAERTFAQRWDGTTWSVVAGPSAGTGALSCVSATDCVAVGFSLHAQPQTSAEQWNGTGWTVIETPNRSGGNVLHAVSCPSSTTCIAVGNSGQATAYESETLVEQYTATAAPTAPPPVVGMAATADGFGDWQVTAGGDISAVGDARFSGSTGAISLNRPIVGMAATPSGHGYWLVASDGGIFTFGDARFYGSTGAMSLNRPIVGMAATPSGHGYWLVASDGGVFSFGDARFHGSTGAMSLNRPIVGMAAAPSGRGYWLVASDGGIFTFGAARFYGSTGGMPLNGPIIGMAATPARGHYLLVASDGESFGF